MLHRISLALLFVLLFIVGTNHCAFEALFSRNICAQGSNCPLHDPADSGSHKEGHPCGTQQNISTSKSLINSGLEAAPIFDHTVADLLSSRNLVGPKIILSMCQDWQRNLSDPDDPLVSLSIASNAPPFSV